MGAHLRLAPRADPETGHRFAEVALTGLVSLGPEGTPGPTGADLALRFGLSAWMRLAGVGPAQAAAALADLRGAVLTGAGLDPRQEPVPFRVPDPAQDLLLLAGYLGELLTRAARTTGTDRAGIAALALHVLAA